jgi:hypothetical protein
MRQWPPVVAGQGPGYPVIIFGGEHADIPLTAHDGAYVAEMIAAVTGPCKALRSVPPVRKGPIKTRYRRIREANSPSSGVAFYADPAR